MKTINLLRLSVLLCLLALALSLVGCGGGSDLDDAPGGLQIVAERPGDSPEGPRDRADPSCPADPATFVGPIPPWCPVGGAS